MRNIKIWRYSIPPVDSIEGWGIFLIDSTGMFAAVTDYGNYAYKWTHHGEKDFRDFIVGAHRSHEYILEKLASKVYSGKKTVKGIKEYILEYRRDGSLTKEFARKEWELIDNMDIGNEIEFKEWYDLTRLDDAGEFYATDWTPSAKAFVKKLLPRLADVLQKELQQGVA